MRRGRARRTVIGGTAVLTAGVLAVSGGTALAAGSSPGAAVPSVIAVPAPPAGGLAYPDGGTARPTGSATRPASPPRAVDAPEPDPAVDGPGGGPALDDPTPDPPPDLRADPGADPGTDPAPDPGTDPAAGPPTGPAGDPGADPAAGPGADPAPEPAPEPGAGPPTGPAGDPGADPAPDPGADPGTDPATDPRADPATDPAVADPPTDPAAADPPTDPAAADPPTDPAAADPPTDPATGPGADPPGPGPAAPGADPAGPGAADPDATTAAERYGWGPPLPASDEFDYTGPPDPARWNTAGECWAGHAGNGGRCASRTTVQDGKLVQTGLANGDSGWVASTFDQQYGRWEARVRSEATGPDNGRRYHPLLIIWPQSDRWPQDGEYDFLENGAPGQDCAEAFIHYPHGRGPVQQEFVRESGCGAPLTEWHNVAFEWTPEQVTGYVDGEEWFSFSGGARGNRRAIQDMPSGHLTIQLDNFFGGDMQPARYEVDWVRIYSLDVPPDRDGRADLRTSAS